MDIRHSSFGSSHSVPPMVATVQSMHAIKPRQSGSPMHDFIAENSPNRLALFGKRWQRRPLEKVRLAPPKETQRGLAAAVMPATNLLAPLLAAAHRRTAGEIAVVDGKPLRLSTLGWLRPVVRAMAAIFLPSPWRRRTVSTCSPVTLMRRPHTRAGAAKNRPLDNGRAIG